MDCINCNELNSNQNGYFNNFHLNILIFNCYFSRTTNYNGRGGIFFLESNLNYELVIKECYFFECRCSGSGTNGGGAIFYNCGNGKSYLNKLCGFKCYTTVQSMAGQFFYIITNHEKENKIECISCLKCAYDSNIIRAYPINLREGIQKGNFINSTNNLNWDGNSVFFFYPNSLDSKFNNFLSNPGSEFFSVYFKFGNGVRILSFSNIVNNTALRGVIFVEHGNFIVNNCIIKDNIGKLFDIYSTALLSIENSKFFHEGNIGPSFIYELKNNIQIKTNTLKYKFYSTIECQTELFIHSTRISNFKIFFNLIFLNFFLIFNT